jgi:enoyl-CoA hydratase/carnithine racemase
MLKETMNRSLPVPEAQIFQRAIDSPELAEGLSAFLEKRAPRWRRGST